MVSLTSAVAVTGIGILTPRIDKFELFPESYMSSDGRGKREIVDVPVPEGQNVRELRRLSKLARMSVFAADCALRTSSVQIENMGIGVALTHGSTSYLAEFHDLLFAHGPEGVSPGAFSNGITNSPLSTISTLFKLTDGGTTFIGYENAGLDLLAHGAECLKANEYGAYLAGSAEEYSPLVESIYSRLGWYNGSTPEFLPLPGQSSGFGVSEGSAFLVLEKPGEDNRERTICTYSPIGKLDCDLCPDLIISGAGGGPQDRFELNALIELQRSCSAEIIFSKELFGECFALGGLLSSVLACSIIQHGTNIIHKVKLNPDLAQSRKIENKKSDKVLVLAASRDGQISAGMFERV